MNEIICSNDNPFIFFISNDTIYLINITLFLLCLLFFIIAIYFKIKRGI